MVTGNKSYQDSLKDNSIQQAESAKKSDPGKTPKVDTSSIYFEGMSFFGRPLNHISNCPEGVVIDNALTWDSLM